MSQFYLLLLHFLCISWLNAEPLVQISQGKLKGITQKSRNGRNFSAFLGIPYAQPPTGKLRFRNPLPADNWTGIRSADAFGNECVQPGNFGNIGNEDCLFLNIYTLRLEVENDNLLPVMVWIHGGAFNQGSSNMYGADYFLDKDVLLVTVNYRLGIFGFFTTGDSAAPGNFGLKDQVLALKWVQENIKAFGGDPNRVTIFGQSAGGASVSLHAISKASNGLFQQYIIQSGSSLCPWAFQKSSKFLDPVKKVAKIVDCPFNTSQNLVNCLQEKNVDTLMDTGSAFDLILRFAFITWTPTDEPDDKDAFLTDTPKNLIENNQMKDLPFVSGVVSDEGLLLTGRLYGDDGMYQFIRFFLPSLLSFMADHFLGLSGQKELFVSAVKNYYFNDSFNSTEKNEFLESLTKILSDGAFIYPELRMIEKVTPKMKNSNYLYSFGYADNAQNNGVSHGAEASYLFPLSSVNLPISEIMVDLWTSFAINGKPTSEKLNQSEIWTPYNPEKNNYLQIGNNNDNTNPKVTLSNSFYKSRMNFWQEKFPI